MDADPDISIVGFRLWVHGYQYPHLSDYYDGNWLHVTAECIGHGATVRITDSCVTTYELKQWFEECEQLSRGKRAHAALPTMKPFLRADVRQGRSLRLRVRLSPDNVTSHHLFRFDIDQSELSRMVNELRVTTMRFPVKGTGSGA